jgi:GTPase SAR1 family protein
MTMRIKDATVAQTPPVHVEQVRDILRRGIESATAGNRPNLASRLHATLARLNRTEAAIVVVGEFKRGKSSIINNLVGQAICPANDDLATSAVTALRYSETPYATVRVRGDADSAVSQIEFDELVEVATEAGNPDNRHNVELVEVGFDSPLLQHGIILVDTPGIGGLAPGYAAATLSFVRLADAVLFVTDASAELAAPEMEFLQRAAADCRAVVVVVNKIDLYPEWRRIVEINRRHLNTAGIDAELIPVSAAIRAVALERGDRALNQESGFPTLLASIQQRVLTERQNVVAREALADVRHVAGQMLGSFQAELEVLKSPETGDDRIAQLEEARERLGHLRGPGARWNVVLNDGFATLSSEVDYQFRGAIRAMLREVEPQIETMDPAKEWPAISEYVQTEIVKYTDEAFQRIDNDVQALWTTILELFQETDVEVARPDVEGIDRDIRELWLDRPLEGLGVGAKVSQGFGVLRGSYMGLLMLGMMGSFLGIAVVGPALIGAGLIFGGRQFLEERTRHVTRRQQQARAFIRQFCDDVQFEVNSHMRDTLRDLQREMRDYFNDELGQLIQQYSQTIASTQQALEQDQAQRAKRIKDLTAWVDHLDGLLKQVDALEGA